MVEGRFSAFSLPLTSAVVALQRTMTGTAEYVGTPSTHEPTEAFGVVGLFWFSPLFYQTLAVDFANGVNATSPRMRWPVTRSGGLNRGRFRFRSHCLPPEVELARESPPHSDKLVTPFKVGKFGCES